MTKQQLTQLRKQVMIAATYIKNGIPAKDAIDGWQVDYVIQQYADILIALGVEKEIK